MLSVVLMAGGILFSQGLPPPMPAPEVHVTNTVNVQVPPMDQTEVANAAITADQAFVVNVLQPVPVQWAKDLCGLPDMWRQTPTAWTYGNSNLSALAKGVMAAGGVLLGFAVTTCGLSLMLGQGFNGGRVVLASVMVTGNLIFWQILIDLNNALNQAIGAPDLCGSLIIPKMNNLVTFTPGQDPLASIAAPVLIIVYAIVSVILLVALVFRLGMVDVLMVAGGILSATIADPRSDYLNGWYWKLSVGAIFGQTLLTIGLQVASTLAGLPGSQESAGMLMGIATLWLCLKLLSMMGGVAVQSNAQGMVMGAMAAVRRLALRAV